MKLEFPLAPVAALVAATFVAPAAFLYLGRDGGGAATDAAANSGDVMLAGLIEDGSSISLSSLKFLVDVTCASEGNGNDAHVFARYNADELARMHDELRSELYPSEQEGEGCSGVLRVESEPAELHAASYSNRVDRLAALRDLQRRRVADALQSRYPAVGSSSDGSSSPSVLPARVLDRTVVAVADLDVAFLPPASDVLSNARTMMEQSLRVRTRIDVLCSAGVDVYGGYYDSFATVLLPDTFVYPLGARMDPTPWQDEDASLIVGEGGFTYVDLLRWFRDAAGGSGDGTVPVRSCFGGLALYRAERWLDFSCAYSVDASKAEAAVDAAAAATPKNARYANKNDKRPCEHIVLHNCMRERDQLTNVAVKTDMMPLWHSGDATAISARKRMDDLREEGWESVERSLQEEFSMPAMISANSSSVGVCSNETTTGCCWDNTTKLLMHERLVIANSTFGDPPFRVYDLCPETVYMIGQYDFLSDSYIDGMAALELFSPNVMVQCGNRTAGNGTDGNVTVASGGGGCVMSGGSTHVWVKSVGGNFREHNITVKGITSVNATGVNVMAETDCVTGDGKSCGLEVVFEDCEFKNNEETIVILRDGIGAGNTPTVSAGLGALEVKFNGCSFMDNNIPPTIVFGDRFLLGNGPRTALSLEGCSFVNNSVPFSSSGEGVYTSSLIYSMGTLDVMDGCFVDNSVGESIAIANGELRSNSANGYSGNEYAATGPCRDGVLTSDGICDKEQDIGDIHDQRCAAAFSPGGNPCGPAACTGESWWCCNPSCGYCRPPDGYCTEEACVSTTMTTTKIFETQGGV